MRKPRRIFACLALIASSPGASARADSSLTTIASFTLSNGAYPQSGVTIDAQGNLYGTTNAVAGGRGTVYEIAAGTNTVTTLATFNGTNGSFLYGGVTIDARGNLYGTTTGTPSTSSTVFEIAAGSNTVTTLASISNNNGSGSISGVTMDASGNLFGTNYNAGASGVGIVYEVAATTHALSTVATFNQANGAGPEAGVTIDSHGNLFGTTNGGGSPGYGTIYEIAAGTNAVTTLANFNNTNGSAPIAGLLMDSHGNLFGTTNGGGSGGNGTVYELAAGSSTITTLATFNGANGSGPQAALVMDARGDLFGTTTSGGANGDGTVFEVVAGSGVVTTLYSFSGADGSNPYSALAFDARGNLYGTTLEGGANGFGTVFELTPPAVPGPASLLALAQGGFLVGAGFLARVRARRVRTA